MKPKYEITQRVRIPVKAQVQGVTITGERRGVIGSICAREEPGEFYSVTMEYTYEIVDNLYTRTNPIWVRQVEILGLDSEEKCPQS